jgi:hypothetical protein
MKRNSFWLCLTLGLLVVLNDSTSSHGGTADQRPAANRGGAHGGTRLQCFCLCHRWRV